MTPQKLKNSILQRAIQGKLVEQRPEEGTAEELYQQIQAEKQALIKAGKIKKEKPLPEIAEEEKPFDIPESWKWCRLTNLVYLTSGNQYEEHDKGIPYLKVADMNLSENIPEIQTSTRFASSDNKGIIPCFSIIFPKRGGAISTNKKRIVIKTPIYVDSNTMGMSIINPKVFIYVKMWFDSVDLGKLQTGTSVPQINNKDLEPLLIPLPPLAEQKRIVAKIEELLPLIDRYEAAYTRLEEFNKRFPGDMQKSLLQMAIQGKLVDQRPEEGTGDELFRQIQAEKQALIKRGELRKTKPLPEINDDELPGDFPESWKVCYIDDIAFVTKLAGFEYTEYVAPNLVSEGIPLFKGKNVQNGKLVLNFESFIPEAVSDGLVRSQIRRRCLLTPYVGTIGNIAIFDGSFRAHLGSNVGKIEILNSDQVYVTEEYLLYYLRSDIGYKELTKYKKATAQESISIDAIRNVIIAIPPLAEQKRIVAKLEELLPLCERLK